MSIECIMNRRSIRKYTSQPVSEEDLAVLLKAGMAAPSAVDERPWEFVVVRDPEKRKAVSNVCRYWAPAAHAPLVIAVCADTTRGDEILRTFFVQDCSCASENILCAAAGIGLGGVWLGVYGMQERMNQLAAVLGMPAGVIPVSVLAIGHPDQTRAPRELFEQNRVHFEQY